ncbi:MAG: hypothetical protein Q8O34_12005 [Rhodocyclaceae bacterium]|nr:hypothetical protein [Rhodocyclaceae bacterium]
MSETGTHPDSTIAEEVLLGRLAQSKQMREFFIQMRLQNPSLARQGGDKVRKLLSPVIAKSSNF